MTVETWYLTYIVFLENSFYHGYLNSITLCDCNLFVHLMLMFVLEILCNSLEVVLSIY